MLRRNKKASRQRTTVKFPWWWCRWGSVFSEMQSNTECAKKFFAHLHLVHDGKSKIVRAQINSASTCNTMPSDLLSHLFQRPEAESAHMKAKQCGQKVKYPSLRQKRQTTDNRSSLWRTSRATNHHFQRKLRHGRFFQFPSKSRGVVYILSIKAYSDKTWVK